MNACPHCHINEANHNEMLGVLPCDDCQDVFKGLPRPGAQVEFTKQSIKEERKTYANDVWQPYRQGELSKEYLDTYGDSRVKVTEKEKRKAKNVWKADVQYYKD